MLPAQQPQTLAGRVPSKRMEVPIEVGLVIVASLVRDLGTGQGLRVSGVETVEHVLQAVEARQRLGRRHQQSLELSDEMLVTDGQLLGERINRERPTIA